MRRSPRRARRRRRPSRSARRSPRRSPRRCRRSGRRTPSSWSARLRPRLASQRAWRWRCSPASRSRGRRQRA
ncbi:hypothetical protein FMM08_20050 [Quadrisphaera setariae]|uniref:Uncharacterized protein n=1 Tax=Quadrisphaera setariae TaxID=2593304 RepID=A0A5C8Z6E2_9ACTN|nr:hypothetical protein FHN55_18335 [Streptomyces sp. NP160]TXR52486.1 hypothetical protein FMM08_20050 [Quadrisphaera setariae]